MPPKKDAAKARAARPKPAAKKGVGKRAAAPRAKRGKGSDLPDAEARSPKAPKVPKASELQTTIEQQQAEIDRLTLLAGLAKSPDPVGMCIDVDEDNMDELLKTACADLVALVCNKYPAAGGEGSSPCAAWVLTALRAVRGGAQLTLDRLSSLKVRCKLSNAAVECALYVTAVGKGTPDMPIMVEALLAAMEKSVALPAGGTGDDAECVLLTIFSSLSSPLPPSAPPVLPMSRVGAEVREKRAVYKSEQLSAVIRKLKTLGFDLDKHVVCYLSQLAVASGDLMNLCEATGRYKPRWPSELKLMPHALLSKMGPKGEQQEDDGPTRMAMKDGEMVSQAVLPVMSHSTRRGRPLNVVAQGYIMYVHMILIITVMIPEGKLWEAYAVNIPGLYLSPYNVNRFTNLLRRIVTDTLLSAQALDDLLGPLLLQAQDGANVPELEGQEWSGDVGVEHMHDQLLQNMSVARATVSQHRQVAPSSGAKGGAVAQKTVTFSTKDRGALPKCKTCDGKSGHETGVCGKCRGVPTALSRKGGGARPVAGGAGVGVGVVQPNP